jgi:hypothetical protein
MKSVAYMALVHLILKYGAACWDPFREGQINALQANLTNDSNLEKLAQCRKTAHICAAI